MTQVNELKVCNISSQEIHDVKTVYIFIITHLYNINEDWARIGGSHQRTLSYYNVLSYSSVHTN